MLANLWAFLGGAGDSREKLLVVDSALGIAGKLTNKSVDFSHWEPKVSIDQACFEIEGEQQSFLICIVTLKQFLEPIGVR